MDHPDHVVGSVAPTFETWAKYAGFWSRFFAYLVDAIVLIFSSAILIVAPMVVVMASIQSYAVTSSVYVLMVIALFFLFMLYDSAFLSSGMMATPGKRLLGIKVTDMNGSQISFPRALLRTVFKFGFTFAGRLVPILCIISWIPLLNPFLIVLTEKKQAIHDYIAGTVVVKN